MSYGGHNCGESVGNGVEEYTFDNIPLGATVTYRGSDGILKTGVVIRKKEDLILGKKRTLRRSVLVRIEGKYCPSRVNLTQFKNVREVKP